MHLPKLTTIPSPSFSSQVQYHHNFIVKSTWLFYSLPIKYQILCNDLQYADPQQSLGLIYHCSFLELFIFQLESFDTLFFITIIILKHSNNTYSAFKITHSRAICFFGCEMYQIIWYKLAPQDYPFACIHLVLTLIHAFTNHQPSTQVVPNHNTNRSG